MKLGQVQIPLADIPGSLVGNWIVYENMFILHGSQWLSWSPDLQRAVACWQAGGWAGFMVHLDYARCCQPKSFLSHVILMIHFFLKHSFLFVSAPLSQSSPWPVVVSPPAGIPLVSMFTFSSTLLTQFHSCFLLYLSSPRWQNPKWSFQPTLYL